MKYLISIIFAVCLFSCSNGEKPLLVFDANSGVYPILHYSIGPEYSSTAFVQYEGYPEDAYIIIIKNGDSLGTDTVDMLPLPALVFWQRLDIETNKYVIDTMFFDPGNEEFFFGYGY